jgi:hypothetical protein
MASSNFEKYLAGEPLTPELAALKAGRLPDIFGIFTQSPAPAAAEVKALDLERDLTRDERIALRELRLAPGWPVLQKLFERATIQHTKAATALSQEQPLGAEISQIWLTVKLRRQVIAELNLAVAVEMQAIEEEMQNEPG